MMKKRHPFKKKLYTIFQTEKIKHIQTLYEHIITSPVLITAVVFIFAFIFVVGLTTKYHYYSDRFRENLMVEAHGVLFDIFMLGMVIVWLQQKGKSKVEKKRYQDEIDDFRGWNSEEAARRIRGNIRRLNSYGFTSIDINNCFLRNMDLRNTKLSGCYAWGVDLSWADLRYSDLSNGNFEDANLAFADISNSEIKNSYFWKADMSNCNLKGANLQNSIMIETNLSNTDFTKADLQNVSFANSNLTNGVFWYTNLYNTDFDSASLEGAKMQHADLSKAIGLDYEELLKVSSLYNAILPDRIKQKIKSIKPSLLYPPAEDNQIDF